MMTRVEVWLKGLLAAAISGAAGGVLTGLAAVGIDPQHFNLQTGIGATFRIGTAAALIQCRQGRGRVSAEVASAFGRLEHACCWI